MTQYTALTSLLTLSDIHYIPTMNNRNKIKKNKTYRLKSYKLMRSNKIKDIPNEYFNVTINDDKLSSEIDIRSLAGKFIRVDIKKEDKPSYHKEKFIQVKSLDNERYYITLQFDGSQNQNSIIVYLNDINGVEESEGVEGEFILLR